jgi:hypothetical protein
MKQFTGKRYRSTRGWDRLVVLGGAGCKTYADRKTAAARTPPLF